MNISTRLNAIIEKDKRINTDKISSVIKSDFYYMISSYFEVEFDSINVEIAAKGEEYVIKLSCLGDKLKFVRSIPE